ncbi:MAG: acetyl-CoA carboxylase biotin carboxyl carrier protein, partial [Mariprofundales bacterium]|nr:acetyl-CoA carboxylase biotin carboxyl carrier protein [Mariprofundales bacterium]
MDITYIRKLTRLLQASDLTEIEVKDGETSVRISRSEQIRSVHSVPAVATSLANTANTPPVTPPQESATT